MPYGSILNPEKKVLSNKRAAENQGLHYVLGDKGYNVDNRPSTYFSDPCSMSLEKASYGRRSKKSQHRFFSVNEKRTTVNPPGGGQALNGQRFLSRFGSDLLQKEPFGPNQRALWNSAQRTTEGGFHRASAFPVELVGEKRKSSRRGGLKGTLQPMNYTLIECIKT